MNEILFKLFREVSRFPRYISCYISEIDYLGQWRCSGLVDLNLILTISFRFAGSCCYSTSYQNARSRDDIFTGPPDTELTFLDLKRWFKLIAISRSGIDVRVSMRIAVIKMKRKLVEPKLIKGTFSECFFLNKLIIILFVHFKTHYEQRFCLYLFSVGTLNSSLCLDGTKNLTPVSP